MLEIGGQPRLLEVRGGGDVNQPRLEVRLLDGPASQPELAEAAALVARCFRVDHDVTPLDALAVADPAYGVLLGRVRGLRALLMPSPFEALVWAIIGQQINIAFAYKLKRVLVEQFGRTIEYDGRPYYLFPTAERLAALEPRRAATAAVQRAEVALHRRAGSLARRWAARPGRSRRAASGRSVVALIGLRGVGRWTAEYVLMRGLGAPDELPAADVGLQIAAWAESMGWSAGRWSRSCGRWASAGPAGEATLPSISGSRLAPGGGGGLSAKSLTTIRATAICGLASRAAQCGCPRLADRRGATQAEDGVHR